MGITSVTEGQILALDGANHSIGQPKWTIVANNLFLGASYLRPEILKQIVFTKDALGNLLTNPDTVLISAGYSTNFITGTVTVKSFKI
jgi:hypothetical protein